MAPMTVDEAMALVRKAREYGGPDHLLQYAILSDEVERLRSVEAEQDVCIASLKGQIVKWATSYNEMQERLTLAQVAHWHRFNPPETT